MCGICGVAGGEAAAGRELVQRMCSSLVHRGPDDEGSLHVDGVTLGMRRLSIIDLEGGHQPMPNEDSTVWAVHNGEIYNHLELRELLGAGGHSFNTQSDTEVLVHGYEQWGGEGLVERLNGMFAFAVLDRRSGTLFLARDRMGIKPLHYAIDGKRLVFASELKALLRDSALRREIDPVALDQYLAYEFVPSPRSIIQGINKLPPAHTLTWSVADGTHRLRRYWTPELGVGDEPRRRSLDEECEELRTVLRESVRKELISDVPLGVFLSGGIDSSAVTAMMTQLGGDVKSFSVGFADRSFDESSHARRVARHLGTEHRELTLEPHMLLDLIPQLPALLDEPLGDASIIPTYLLSAFTRQHVKVALGGDGGDELFAGYPTLQAHRLAAYYMRAPRVLREGLVEPVVRRLPVSRGNVSFDFRAKRFVSGAAYPIAERHQRWMGSFNAQERELLLTKVVRHEVEDGEAVYADPLNQVLMMDMRLYLENDILVKLDRASMMASLEGRVPLLNNDFVEYATRLPLKMKLRGLRSKFLLRRALRGLLPDAILNRPKKGFGIPVAHWFRGPLKEQMLSVLSPERIARKGLFDPKVVAGLIADHLDGRRDNRKQLWTLFAFELWHDGYMSGS
jgi:asparagine synthase (glutamine-hydrolysing)